MPQEEEQRRFEGQGTAQRPFCMLMNKKRRPQTTDREGWFTNWAAKQLKQLEPSLTAKNRPTLK
jgi:hypothetical protein